MQMQVISVEELVKYQGENVIVDSFEAVPMSVLEDIKAEIYKERTNLHFDISEEKAKWVNSGIYDGLVWAEEIIDKHTSGKEQNANKED